MKRRTAIQEKRARKKSAKLAKLRAPGTKSRYQRKIARKLGRGRINPNWQWWMERVAPTAAIKEAA